MKKEKTWAEVGNYALFEGRYKFNVAKAYYTFKSFLSGIKGSR